MKDQLTAFVAWSKQHIQGDEKGEAHLFLDRLFKAFGQPGCLEAGGHLEYRVKKGKADGGGTAFADYVWKPVVLIEMKRRGVVLQKHYRQAFDYWTRLVPSRPRYVILCNFDELQIYDFETQMDAPVDVVTLENLPERYGALNFLAPGCPEPIFGNDHVAVTRQAADYLATCFNHLVARGTDRPLAQRFILQTLVSLFSEDIGLLPKYFVTQLLHDCTTPEASYDLMGGLFQAMNTDPPVSGGRYRGVQYFNGGLFAQPARLELDSCELDLLRRASAEDWSKVQPEIFGTLFQHSMDATERHAFGAHFTHPVDIMKIVGPTIVEPWREHIENAASRKTLLELLNRLHQFHVLDPACGSGNFLYIAYRQLKSLEARIYERLQEMTTTTSDSEKKQSHISYLSAKNFFGMDINPFAVEIAKVTMVIARKLAIDEFQINEEALPLDNLDANFIAADALITPEGKPTAWPKADVIIGNPPFLGAKRLKPEHGADYVNALRRAYPKMPGMADFCVFWFRKAHDHLPPCTAKNPLAGRAGLVGTQNIRNNKSRVGGLDHIAASGTIIDAVENQPWSGEANVHVSIANWVKTQDAALLPAKRRIWSTVCAKKGASKQRRAQGGTAKGYELDMRECLTISSALSDATDLSSSVSLLINQDPQRVFQGVTPGYDGFVITPKDASLFLSKDRESKGFLRPYLIGRELVSGSGKPQRVIIDCHSCSILDIERSHTISAYLRARVLPAVVLKLEEVRAGNSDMVRAREEHLNRWWTFWAQRTELRQWMASHSRIIAGSRTQRWPFVFEFISTMILPGDKLQLFAFDDDYSYGVLHSMPHCCWYERRATRLKNEEDYNYSSDSVFDSFPWPQSPSFSQVNAVVSAVRAVRQIRAESLPKLTGGLRALYHTLALPGANPLKDAHRTLDHAVLNAYGFDAKKEVLAQLLELNQQVSARLKTGLPVTAPGIPPSYPAPEELITSDCILPPSLDT